MEIFETKKVIFWGELEKRATIVARKFIRL
jgi:hypothetical protein